jgi:hypothetical protein
VENLIVILIILVSVGIPAVILIRMGMAKRANSRILETGKRASGVITAIRQTGMYINEQPQVEFSVRVEPVGEPPFDTTFKRIVSLLEIPNIQPGTRVELAYDPADRSKAAFAPDDPTTPSVSARDQLKEQALLVDQLKTNDRLNEVGLQASAIVLEFVDRNIFVNGDNKAADLRVKVLPPGGDPFDSVIHGVFTPEGLFKYQAGKEIPVKYDPADFSAVSIDYARTSVEKVD